MSKTGRDKGRWFAKRSNRGTRGAAKRKNAERSRWYCEAKVVIGDELCTFVTVCSAPCPRATCPFPERVTEGRCAHIAERKNA